MINLIPTQANILRRGLDYLLTHPDHVIESDFNHIVWLLAQMATQAIASQDQPAWPDEDTLVEFVNLCLQYPHEAKLTLWQKATQPADDMQAASDLAMQAEPSPEYITLAVASRRYGVPASTLRWHARRGHFDCHKREGRTWLVEEHDLVLWLSE